jgi:DNA-binding response OmpR family regulator
MFRILVAEDNKAIQMYYEDELTEAGYEVITTGDAPRIMALISEGWPDLVVLDIGLGNCDSLDFLQHIKNNDHRLPVIIYTAYPSFENDLRSVAADCYLVKNSDLRELKSKIKSTLASQQVLLSPIDCEKVQNPKPKQIEQDNFYSYG